MSWNYRVIRKKYANEYIYAIHEVYYNDVGVIDGWTVDSMTPMGVSTTELLAVLNDMVAAQVKPVLIEKGDTLVELFKDNTV